MTTITDFAATATDILAYNQGTPVEVVDGTVTINTSGMSGNLVQRLRTATAAHGLTWTYADADETCPVTAVIR